MMVLWIICGAIMMRYRAEGAAVGLCPVPNTGNPARDCNCASTIIDCSNRGLTDVPIFRQSSAYTELRIYNNNIANITDNAFKNIQRLNTILLQNNNIDLMERDAFAGVEKSVLRLNLADNILTEIPEAIAILEQLDWLDVSRNHIDGHHFTEHVMYEIGDHLTRFDFGSPHIQQWPTTIHHLQDLQYLNVTGGSFFTIPPDAFHGFEGTLKTLSIQYTDLIAIPLSLSRLRFLDRLYFDHNHAIGDSGILIPSFGRSAVLEKLTFISLADDGLTVFPSFLQYLRHARELVLDSNRLAIVSDSSIQGAVGTAITSLSVRNCSLSCVPGALSKLTNLTSLDLSNNDIHSFENGDFEGMNKLRRLGITYNPLDYIANGTFKDLHSLEILNLEHTRVRTFSEAIRFLLNLKELKVSHSRIECTCNIVWLKQFKEQCNKGYLVIDGSCETIRSSIDRYLKDFIPNCPNYHHGTTQCAH